jgi:1,2-diacylglycerol 3-alpha-glucosyltransferase
MKIAVFSECYTPIVNGVVVAVSTLCRELLRLGHEICLFPPAYPGYHDTEPFVFRFPSISLPTNPRYPLGIPYVPSRVWRVLEDFAPDVVHTHSLFGMGRAAAKIAARRQTPLIFTYHTLIEAYSHYVPLPQPFVKAMARRISRQFANRADQVIAPGPAAEQALRRYGVTTPISIIPTGADLSLLAQASSPEVRQRWGIPPEAPLICFAGRIAKEKNLELLLAAFAQARREIPAAQLIFAGGGPWQEQIKAKIRLMQLTESARITGFLSREEIFQVLKQSQIFAFPSLTDTQGIVVIEGMSCGLPVVAVRSGAVTEVLREDREGLLVEPQAEQFADGLLKLLKDEPRRKAMGEQAALRAQEFSAPRCVRQMVTLYEKALVENKRKSPGKSE